MNAGFDIDVATAKAVGWRVLTAEITRLRHGDDLPLNCVFQREDGILEHYVQHSPRYLAIERWNPSTNIAASMRAAEHVRLFDTYYLGRTEWGTWAVFDKDSVPDESGYGYNSWLTVFTEADTAPLAICRAILKEHEVPYAIP